MSSLFPAFALAAVAAFAVDASAQQVTLRGKVEDAATGGFVVDCTDTVLTSSAFNLDDFRGEQVELSGAWNGSTDAPSVDVTAIAKVAETFEIGGGGHIGDEVRFEVTSTPGDVAIMFVALDSGFLPAKKNGVLLLDFTAMLHVATATVDGTGVAEVHGDIPNDPALEGVIVYGQSLIAFAAGGSTLSNSDCVTLHR